MSEPDTMKKNRHFPWSAGCSNWIGAKTAKTLLQAAMLPRRESNYNASAVCLGN